MPPSQALLTFALKFYGLLYRFQILRLSCPVKRLRLPMYVITSLCLYLLITLQI